MRAVALSLRHELIGLAGVVERIVYLTRRYIYWDVAFFVWTVANTLTIVFIAEGIEAAGGQIDVERATMTLLIGAVVWYGWGLGLMGTLNVAAINGVGIAIFVGLCLFSALWLSVFRFGPVEWLWRSVSYGAVQPIRKGRP